MSFFSFKHKSPLAFVFDIRDSSVSLAVARFQSGQKPELMVCKNFKIDQTYVTDHKKYLTALLKTIDTAIVHAIKDLRKMGNKEKIGKYIFFVGSPWSISTTKIIKIIKDNPFTINDDFLKSIITSEEALANKEIQVTEDYKEWAVLEEKIIQSKLNGYKVERVFNKKANSLEIELFVSFVPSDIQDKVSSYIDAKFGENAVRYSNSTLISSYTFLKDLYADKNNFLYIDIGHILTDVYVVIDDVVSGIISFPFGEKDIIARVLEKTNISEEILLSNISAKHSGHDDMMNKKDTEKLLDFGVKIWLGLLSDAIGKIAKEPNIPSHIFMVTNSPLSDFIAREFTNKKASEPLKLLGVDMEVELISEGVLNPLITNGKNFADEPYIKMDLVFAANMLK